MKEKKESNLHACLLALRGQAQLTEELHETALAVGALSWVTLDLIPRSLRIVFLNAVDQSQEENLTAFLEDVLPKHASYQLVDSFHGVDAVVRGQLPSGWVLKNLVGRTKLIKDLVEFEVKPIERFWWRDVPSDDTRRSGTHFEPSAPEIKRELPRYLLSPLRFIYNPARLPTLPVYALIEPIALDSKQRRKVLSDLARTDLGKPIRDLFLIEGRAADRVSKEGLDRIFRKVRDQERFCGIAVCEFIDLPKNGHGFRQRLEEFHWWRKEVLQRTSLGIRSISYLPFLGQRESYEGGEAADSAMRIIHSYDNRMPFACPGFARNGEERMKASPTIDLKLELPIGHLVVCGSNLSGRSVLATWICRQFLEKGYNVVYVAVTGHEVESPEEGPADQKSASLFGKMVSQVGPVRYSDQYGVRNFLQASRSPLAIYTEFRESSLLREQPDLFVKWLTDSSTDKLFVMFDEVQQGGLTWINKLQEKLQEKLQKPPKRELHLHLGFVCQNVDQSIKDLALQATVIVTNLSHDYNSEETDKLVKDLLERAKDKEHEVQVLIKWDDLMMKSNRNFVLFPRPKDEVVYPVRGSLPEFGDLDHTPSEPILWSPWPEVSAGPPTEGENTQQPTSPWPFDVFISHASEDKETVVEPLIRKLREHNISYWLDSEHINAVGDVPERINEGLTKSQFMVVVLSSNYLKARWAKKELSIAISWENSLPEEKFVLLLVGNEKEQEENLKQAPIVLHKRRNLWDDTGESFAQVLLVLLKRPAP